MSKHFHSLLLANRFFPQRKRSCASGAPSTTVRSLRELQWSPALAFAGVDGASDLVLAMHAHPSFADQSHEAFASKK
jgi:hypothetical protein